MIHTSVFKFMVRDGVPVYVPRAHLRASDSKDPPPGWHGLHAAWKSQFQRKDAGNMDLGHKLSIEPDLYDLSKDLVELCMERRDTLQWPLEILQRLEYLLSSGEWQMLVK